MIYFGRRYTCTVNGSVWKNTQCEGCQCQYVYLMSRTGTGSGRSPYYMDNEGAQRRAQDAAVKNLQRRLDRDLDPVACPDCGLYQPAMVRLLRRRRWGWVHICGWIVIAAAFVVALLTGDVGRRAGPNFGERLISLPSVAILGFGVGLIALSWGGRSLYDPNVDATERAGPKESSAEGPHRRAEFEVLVRAAQEQQRGTQRAAEEAAGLPPSNTWRVRCPKCHQTFVTSAKDRCPLCRADWSHSPPEEAA
jgi:hypothetical protein